MTQQQATWAKLGLVFLLLVGGFALVMLGKLDAPEMYKDTATAVAALVVALGISGGISGGAQIAARMKGPLVMIGLLLFVGAASVACSGCTKEQGAQVETVAIDTGICLLSTYATDIQKGESSEEATADAAQHCLVNLTDAQRFLDAHRAAAILDSTPRPAPARVFLGRPAYAFDGGVQ